MQPKKTIILLVLALLCITLVSCEKQEDLTPAFREDKLIKDAKQDFDKTVLEDIITNSISQNKRSPRQRLSKTLHWDKAHVKKILLGEAVVVPVTLAGNLAVQIEGIGLVQLPKKANLFIYKDSNNVQHIELATIIPDGAYIKGTGKRKFSGRLLIEDWHGNFLKGWDITPNQQLFFFDALSFSDDADETQIENIGTTQTHAVVCLTTKYYYCVTAGSSNHCSYSFQETRCYNTDYDGNENEAWDYLSEDPGGIGGGDGGTSPTYKEEEVYIRDVTKDPSLLNNQKVNCVYEKLGGGAAMQALISMYEKNGATINLTYKVGPLPSTVNGLTAPTDNTFKNIVITLNENYASSGRTIQLARTLLHESIHAKIFSYLRQIGGYEHLAPDNFPVMFDAYAEAKKNGATMDVVADRTHHEEIAANYLEYIAVGLREFDELNHGNPEVTMDHYRALAWDGLRKTKAWNNLTKEQQDKVDLKTALVINWFSSLTCTD